MMDESIKNEQHCIPLETLCLVYGMVCSALSVFGLAVLTFAQILGILSVGRDFYRDDEAIATLALVIFLYIYCISSFVFSALLSYGAYERRSCLLKAYLVYGAVSVVLTVTGATVYFCFSWLLDSVGFCIVFFACCINSLPLFMVQRTCQKFRTEKALYIMQLSEYFGR